jgi:hypothetical protein
LSTSRTAPEACEDISDSFTRHSGEAYSTVPHLPKLGHIGNTANARGFTYATCCALHTLVARQGMGHEALGVATAALLLPNPS